MRGKEVNIVLNPPTTPSLWGSILKDVKGVSDRKLLNVLDNLITISDIKADMRELGKMFSRKTIKGDISGAELVSDLECEILKARDMVFVWIWGNTLCVRGAFNLNMILHHKDTFIRHLYLDPTECTIKVVKTDEPFDNDPLKLKYGICYTFSIRRRGITHREYQNGEGEYIIWDKPQDAVTVVVPVDIDPTPNLDAVKEPVVGFLIQVRDEQIKAM